ncbi:MAG: F0F1 ATP synthase subunit delta [Gammaproteobacteria bacterium]|nr:F0F1 ATP synthase subunit delta [Gammaproteobacteria bacterium]
MAENIGIARPYAEAVFQLARETGQLAGWSDALHAAAATVADEDVARLIDRPDSDKAKIAGLVADIAGQAAGGAADAARLGNLLKLLAENGRLLVLDDMATQFDKLKADVENSIDVVLTAASPVDPAQRAKIIDALKRRFGREINLHFKLDENLIGGARLQADDLVIDGSIRTGLDKMSSALTN